MKNFKELFRAKSYIEKIQNGNLSENKEKDFLLQIYYCLDYVLRELDRDLARDIRKLVESKHRNIVNTEELNKENIENKN